MMSALPVIGWREWLALPQLGVRTIKAKIDTGARSSALHVEALEVFRRRGIRWLRFRVDTGRRGIGLLSCEAPVHDRRIVTDSGGHRSARWFIRTRVELAGASFMAEINLTDRRNMLFPLLLGRTALAHRFRIDPAQSYVCEPSRRTMRSLEDPA
jgi:hypothetical protein